MDTDTADELQILRSRAYGPSADIDTDSAALRRLRELEGLVSVPAPIPLDTSSGVDSSHSAGDQGFADAPDVVTRASEYDSTGAPDPDRSRTVDPDEPVPDPSADHNTEHRPRPRLSWGVRLLWAASIVAAAGIATAITYGLLAMSPVSASSGAPQIATLRPAPLVEVPSGWFGAGPSSRAWEFHGLTLFETSNGMYGAGGGDCLAVVTTAAIPAEQETDQDSWSMSGPAYSACRVGAFPATVEMVVDSNAPKELRAAYPDSALQFVKQGDQIGVFRDKD